jgi:pimeloyl-ACP methyl ester carboxylesterase
MVQRAEPAIRYVRTIDGVGIAYQTLGEGDPALIHMPPFPLSNMRMEWASGSCRRYLQTLAEKHMVVRYDCRGAGLSDREAPDYSLEASLLDLEAVTQRLRLERFALFGFNHLGLAATMYAARFPESVTHLILWCSYIRASDYSGSERVQAAWSLIDRDWEMYTELEGYRATGWKGGPAARGYTEYLRQSVTQQGLKAAFEAIQDGDVAHLLEGLRVPTLVMHRVGSAVLDVSIARELAERIPNAELALIEGSWRAPWVSNGDLVADRITRFLTEAGVATGPDGLTRREVEILRLVAEGRSNREIAGQLVLSERTVARHITNIYSKAGLHSRADATAYAFRHRVV